jgi:O-antigen/teichoic acid export membrane protein
MSDGSDSDESLRSLGSVSQGAGLFIVGKGVSNGLGLVTNAILTRILGASLYGIYSYISVVFALVSVFTNLGGDQSLLRFIPEYEDNPHMQHTVLTLAYVTSFIASILAAGIVFHFAPLISAYTLKDPLFVNVLRIAAIVLPFNTLANITYSVFKGIERMEYNVAVSSVVQPLLRLLFVGGAVLLGYSLIGAVAGLIVSGVLTFVVVIVVLVRKTRFGTLRHPTRRVARRYYDFSLPLMFTQFGSFLYNRVDILMVGFLLSGSAVGIYNITVMISSFLALPLQAFNQLFPSIASKLYHDGKIRELESTYATVTRWTFTLALFPSIVVITYPTEILRLFGNEFTAGQFVLILFVIAQFTYCAVGPSGYLLMMSDHHYLTLFNQTVSGVLNVILNLVLIREFGFIGAALATASVLTGINLLRVIEVWYLEDITPYDRAFLKPISAGCIGGIVLYSLRYLFSGFILLIVGGIVGGVVFFGMIYLLGLQDEEVKLYNNILEYMN